MIELRPYQYDGIAACRNGMRAVRRVLYVAPTGSGKTVLFAFIAAQVAIKGKRAIILVHRRELVRQTAAKLASFDIACGYVVAGKAANLEPPITVAAVQTLAARPSLALKYDLVVIDEAYHAVAGTWAKVLERLPTARVLGVTATPERLDGRGLSDVFDVLISGPTVRALVTDGFLAPSVCYARPGAENALRSLRRVRGDYSPGEAAELMMKLPVTAAAISDYRILGEERPGFAFCCTVAHAEAVTGAFAAAGIPAASLDGTMSSIERDGILSAFAAGSVRILSSCALLSEGFDAPDSAVAILLRPTLSRALYRQQVGRVLRPKADGGSAIVLDYGGNLWRHGLPTMEPKWSLDGKDKAEPEPTVKECPACSAAMEHAERTCPVCGFFPSPPPAFIEEDLTGDLHLIDEQMIIEAMADERPYREVLGLVRTREHLQMIATAKGYKQGWVWHTAKELGLS
jgi:superfamily II DNA or RNA helicase